MRCPLRLLSPRSMATWTRAAALVSRAALSFLSTSDARRQADGIPRAPPCTWRCRTSSFCSSCSECCTPYAVATMLTTGRGVSDWFCIRSCSALFTVCSAFVSPRPPGHWFAIGTGFLSTSAPSSDGKEVDGLPVPLEGMLRWTALDCGAPKSVAGGRGMQAVAWWPLRQPSDF